MGYAFGLGPPLPCPAVSDARDGGGAVGAKRESGQPQHHTVKVSVVADSYVSAQTHKAIAPLICTSVS